MNDFYIHFNGKEKQVDIIDHETCSVNDVQYKYEIIRINDESFLLKVGNRFRKVFISKNELTDLHLSIDGKPFELKIRTSLQEKASKLIEGSGALKHHYEIKAPMPGMILKIKRQVGDEVKVGDPVVILEAMKMENELRSPVNGIIAKINAKEGNPVEKGSLLFLIE